MLSILFRPQWVNTSPPGQNGRHFADDIFKCIFLNENVQISLKISLKFVPRVRINSIPALVQIMAWCRIGDKPLSEPMKVRLLTNICVTRPQWVNKHAFTSQTWHDMTCHDEIQKRSYTTPLQRSKHVSSGIPPNVISQFTLTATFRLQTVHQGQSQSY